MITGAVLVVLIVVGAWSLSGLMLSKDVPMPDGVI